MPEQQIVVDTQAARATAIAQTPPPNGSPNLKNFFPAAQNRYIPVLAEFAPLQHRMQAGQGGEGGGTRGEGEDARSIK